MTFPCRARTKSARWSTLCTSCGPAPPTPATGGTALPTPPPTDLPPNGKAGGKKTDELVEIDGVTVGVSVTRALTFVDPTNRCGTPSAQAMEDLLSDKLGDLPLSAANADPADAWDRSLLAVVACDDAHADLVEAAWLAMDPSITQDFLVMVTVTEGDDAFLFD